MKSNKYVNLLLILIIVCFFSTTSYSDEIQPTPNLENSQKVKWSTSIFYSTADKLSFSNINATIDGEKYSGNANYGIQNGFGLAIEAYQSDLNTWGWSAGIAYDNKREIKNYNITLGGASDASSYNTSPPSITFYNIFGNVIYRWNKVYLPIGLNFSVPTLNSSTGFSASGTLGSQIGLGVYVSNELSLELLMRNISIKSEKSGANYHFDLGTGYISGINFQFKFHF